MRTFLIVVASLLLMACLGKIADGQGVVCDGQTCQLPSNTGWRAAAQKSSGFPLGGRLVPVKPFIRPIQPQQPRQPTQINVPAPQVIMQPDPSGARAADALDRIAANTEPPPLPEQAKEGGTNPLIVVLCALGAVVAGFVIYYAVGKG